MLQMVAMPAEREPTGLAQQLGEAPTSAKGHTHLCTRELASLLPSLSLPLRSRVKRMAREKEATGLEPCPGCQGGRWIWGEHKILAL